MSTATAQRKVRRLTRTRKHELTHLLSRHTFSTMNAVEFITELSGANSLPIPVEVVAQLPKTGRARIIVLIDQHGDDADWRAGTYEQFLRDDPQEDAIYDSCR